MVAALYEFHPLAQEYDLLEDDDFEEMCESLRQDGLDDDGLIVLYEGKILDGRNRYRACLKVGVEPRFRVYDPARDGLDPADFVRRRNEPRRHDAATIRQRRRKARIKKTAELREAGQSIRSIAETTGVSRTQVEKDLKESTVHGGGTVEPKEGKVKGKDGKTRTAKPKRSSPKPKAAAEAALNGQHKIEEPPPEKDEIGLPIPDKLKPVFASRQLFAEARDLHRQLTAKLNEIALLDAVAEGRLRKELSRRERDGKPFYRLEDLERVKTVLDFWEPYVAHCPWCLYEHEGKFQKSCKACYGAGWVPKRVWTQSAKEDQERVKGLVEECV